MADEREDFMAKLRQIEEQAYMLAADHAAGLAKARLQHIAVLAKSLRGRLELGALAGGASPQAKTSERAPPCGPGPESG